MSSVPVMRMSWAEAVTASSTGGTKIAANTGASLVPVRLTVKGRVVAGSAEPSHTVKVKASVAALSWRRAFTAPESGTYR